MILIKPVKITDAMLGACNISEPSTSDPLAWSASTTYALGVRVCITSTHKIYQSLQAGNAGHAPTGLITDLYWQYVGPTNRWNLFDESISTQATNATSIDVTLYPSGRIDSVSLLNVSAQSARVIMIDTKTGTNVYDKTIKLASNSNITDWFSYFYEPIKRKSDLVFSNLPPYSDPTIRVILYESSGVTVKCGAIVTGLSQEMGGTQYGAKVGISDYSVKKQDDFGSYTVLQRAFRKTANFTLQVNSDYVDQLHTLLSGLRSTPIVFVGSDDYASSIIYGFYKDFSVTIAYPTVSICSIDIEGLT